MHLLFRFLSSWPLPLLHALGGPKLADLCETSFHNAFVLQPGAEPRWARFSYGEPSAAAAAGCL